MTYISNIEPNTPAFSFADPAWRPFPREKQRELNLASCELWQNSATKSGALVCRKANKYPQYPLSKSGLDYLLAAVRAGKLESGWVVLAGWEGSQRIPINILYVLDVVETLKDITPTKDRSGRTIGSKKTAAPYGQEKPIY